MGLDPRKDINAEDGYSVGVKDPFWYWHLLIIGIDVIRSFSCGFSANNSFSIAHNVVVVFYILDVDGAVGDRT